MRIFAVQFLGAWTKENVEAYKIGLGDLKSPALLDRAITWCLQHAPRTGPDAPSNRPGVEMIRERYHIEFDLSRPGYRGYEDSLTKEERDKVADNVRAEMHKKFPGIFKA